MGTYYYDLNNAIKVMHFKYGEGGIIEIRRFADGKLEVEVKSRHSKNYTVKGKTKLLADNKYIIKIYGHQKTVTII